MNMPRVVAQLVMLCGGLLMTCACATTGRPGTFGAPDARPTAGGPTKEACAEVPALTKRLARLESERARIHERLAAAGFERTSAEAIGDGTAAPGLALEAVRSADALEKQLADRTPAYSGLGAEIDWIAANWFDPALMRWTSAQTRALTTMNAETFRDLKAETVVLRTILQDLADSKRRQEELKGCGSGRAGRTDNAGAVVETRTPPTASTESATTITCGSSTTTVNCQDAAVVRTVDPAAVLRSLNSSSFSREELGALGPDTSAWIAFARSAAGATDTAGRTYVDGMPAPGNVPSSMVGRITVNGDPFSAEYSNVGEMRIDVDLRPAERRWHAGLSSPSLSAGGGSPLGPTGTPTSRNVSMSVSGPVPRLPLTFSAQTSQSLDARRPLFVAPGAGGLALGSDNLQSSSTITDLFMSTALVTRRATIRASFSGSRMEADHAGIGGTNGPTTGQRLDSQNQRWQVSWRVGGGLVHRGGITFAANRLLADADSTAPLVVVTEQLVTGGDELARNVRRSGAWTAKHVIESSTGTWTAGVEGRSEIVSDARTFNPSGRLQLSAVDAPAGTWFISRGDVAATERAASAAIFAERFAVHTPRTTVRTGLRVDWQRHASALWSPRVVAAVRVGGVQLSGGAGLFVQSWSPELFVMASERSGTQGETFVVHGEAGAAFAGINPPAGETLRMALAPRFSPRRDLVVRGGVQRNFGPLRAGVEHTWTRGESLPGAAREREATGLVDWVSSDRALRRQQTYVSASTRSSAGSVSAYYQHVWSFDDSDGPLISPARSGDIRGEWARSANVARHAAGVTGIARLPGQIRATLAVDLRTGAPYTILTGNDPDGLGVFTDRGGRPRNTGTLPPARSVSVSLARTVSVPRASWLRFDVGLRADNLTNHSNVTSVGRVVGSPTFGLPLDASAGRSIRLWASLGR